mmetsp:Transcript_5067/g.7501  ORF Transcript_5067/g.7501 Transcript_5067/m.7501 type:complete len:81 (-) Transcript_5067:341-583(-)
MASFCFFHSSDALATYNYSSSIHMIVIKHFIKYPFFNVLLPLLLYKASFFEVTTAAHHDNDVLRGLHYGCYLTKLLTISF